MSGDDNGSWSVPNMREYLANLIESKDDPTKLTTDAVDKAVLNLRELYDLRFEQMDLRLEQRWQSQSKSLDAALIAADLKSNALSDKIEQVSNDLKAGTTRQEYNALVTRLNEHIAFDTAAYGEIRLNYLLRAEFQRAHEILDKRTDELRAWYYEATGISSGTRQTMQVRRDESGDKREDARTWISVVALLIAAVSIVIALLRA